tara:strand:+ start:16856 stop:17383 length:528 start_codon:yes stop_codon:yes gene_type:complete
MASIPVAGRIEVTVKSMHDTTSVSSPTSMAPCVILAPADHVLGSDLPACLAGRGWTSRIEHDARMALAEACLIRRSLMVRQAWDDDVATPPGLLVVDPDRFDDLDALRDAVREYLPDLPLWRWDGEAILPLDPPEAEPPSDSEPNIPASLPFRPEPLTHDEVSMLLHGRRDPETP